jgi:FlaA1/EpsC-like NDP-sugar epimerase
VLYSTGSVLCKWKASIQRGEKIIITAPEATRYFWSIDQAIDLIFDCMTDAINSEPYCPAMKSMKLADLLQAMIEKYSNGQNIEVETIGLQPGENLHERVLEEGLYSNEAERFTTEEIKAVI